MNLLQVCFDTAFASQHYLLALAAKVSRATPCFSLHAYAPCITGVGAVASRTHPFCISLLYPGTKARPNNPKSQLPYLSAPTTPRHHHRPYMNHPLPHCRFQASSSTVFRTHFPYRDSDEDYLVLIGGCAPIDIGAFVDDDRAAVKDGQLLVDESSETSRRIRFGVWVFLLVCFYSVSQARFCVRCGLDCARLLSGRHLTSDQILGLASTEMLRGLIV